MNIYNGADIYTSDSFFQGEYNFYIFPDDEDDKPTISDVFKPFEDIGPIQLQDNYFKDISKRYVIFSSVLDWMDNVKHWAETLTNTGLFTRNNRKCRTVLGMKGVGKTTTLQMSTLLLSGCCNVLCIYVNFLGLYEDVIENYKPSAIISNVLGLKTDNLLDVLKVSNYPIYFIADEIQHIFRIPRSESIINELLQMGGDMSGKVLSVISGSSKDLRKLVYGKFNIQDVSHEYPSYNRQDFNGTKYQRFDFNPISLDDYMELSYTQDLQYPSNEDIDPKFFLAHGNCGLLFSDTEDDVWVNTINKYLTTKSFVNSEETYWKLLCIELTERDYEWVDLGELDINPLDTRKLLDYKDEGLIQVDETKARVKFISPIVYERYKTLYHGRGNTFNYYDRICLMYPYSVLGQDAEHTFRRCLSMSTILGVNLFYRQKLSLGNVNLNHTEREDIETTKNVEDLIGGVYEEYPDKYGADVIVFTTDEDMTVHRIQLKLGTTKMSPGDAKTIANKLKRGDLIIAENFGENLKIVHYIATTREMSPKTIKVFEDDKINIWNRSYMIENIWSNDEKLTRWAVDKGLIQYAKV